MKTSALLMQPTVDVYHNPNISIEDKKRLAKLRYESDQNCTQQYLQCETFRLLLKIENELDDDEN